VSITLLAFGKIDSDLGPSKMLRLEIPDDVLIRAVSDACSRHLHKLNEFSGYLDLKGSCKFLSVGETQFKKWVKLGYIHPRKVSSHLVRFHIGELTDFVEQFKAKKRARLHHHLHGEVPSGNFSLLVDTNRPGPTAARCLRPHYKNNGAYA
jgi:hypothetical protein